VGIRSEKRVLHCILGVGCFAKQSESPSIKQWQAIWQDVLQPMSCVLVDANFATFESSGVRVSHAVILLPQ
jgi:hypothetical protein